MDGMPRGQITSPPPTALTCTDNSSNNKTESFFASNFDPIVSTFVLALGEFGRTPKISTLPGRSTTGRDHWSYAMSVLMAGGRIPGGMVVGATDRNGYSSVDRVLSPENFASTVYRKLGIDPGKVLYTPEGRPTHLVSDTTPIGELC